jgi:hypothetical protein
MQITQGILKLEHPTVPWIDQSRRRKAFRDRPGDQGSSVFALTDSVEAPKIDQADARRMIVNTIWLTKSSLGRRDARNLPAVGSGAAASSLGADCNALGTHKQTAPRKEVILKTRKPKVSRKHKPQFSLGL